MAADDALTTVLSRTSLNVPFQDLLSSVERDYPEIGRIVEFVAIPHGYHDANVRITTTTDTYLLKVLRTERTIDNIHGYVRVLLAVQELAVPVPQILFGRSGAIGVISHSGIETHFIVMSYFQGRSFLETTPDVVEMRTVAKYVARINRMDFFVDGIYDSWALANFLAEYNRKSGVLTEEQHRLIAPAARQLRRLPTAPHTIGILHGDMQRGHVLTNDQGDLCLIDFGCATQGYIIFELATVLAWFCLDADTWSDREKIVSTVLSEYIQVAGVSKTEVAMLPELIEAAYASYYLQASLLVNQGDRSSQTLRWLHSSERMLHLVRGREWTDTPTRALFHNYSSRVAHD
jgi:Ser/Thr protein kinase RdoA (MazF antagonist)